MKPPTAEQRHHGVACVTARDFRWERGDIKSISLLGNVLARQMSADHGAVETIMFRDGYLTEAAASNVWVVHEGALLGPPKSEHVLEGIRVELLRELCEEVRHRLQPAPDPRGRRAAAPTRCCSARPPRRCCRSRTLDGEPVGHGALRGKPGPGLCAAVRGLPARQGAAVDLSAHDARRHARSTVADRVPERLPDQGDGRATSRASSEADGRRSRCSSTRPSTRPRVRAAARAAAASTWA